MYAHRPGRRRSHKVGSAGQLCAKPARNGKKTVMDTAHAFGAMPPYFTELLVFLGAAVVAASLARWLGFGIVVGLLAVGMIIGPSGFDVFPTPERIRVIAELGVVLLLFVIGLELEPSRLWAMRTDIFIIGFLQIIVTAILVTPVMLWLGFPVAAASVIGVGLALSSTAFVMQLLQDSGQLSTRFGQRSLGILLSQDMAIVPLMAVMPLLSGGTLDGDWEEIAGQVMTIILAISVVIVCGRYLLTPVFRLLARAGGREAMLVAALLVALGGAAILLAAGLPMELGAFLAGAMLAESSFRHTLSADIDPFRIILMGLFFVSIGMALDLGLVLGDWLGVTLAVIALVTVKALVLWLICRIFGSDNSDALRIAVTLPQGSEFGFVAFALAAGLGIISPSQETQLVAVIVLSMILTPVLRKLHDGVAARLNRRGVAPTSIGEFGKASPRVIIIGFGRFGMTVAQMIGSEEIEIIAIDNQVRRIEHARKLGYTVYFGDARRIDVLAAAGAHRASLIACCVGHNANTLEWLDAIQNRFSKARLFCRANNRAEEIALIRKGVDFQIAETFESGVSFGRHALGALGFGSERINEVEEDVRQRDQERLALQLSEGTYAGADRLHRKTPHSRQAGISQPKP